MGARFRLRRSTSEARGSFHASAFQLAGRDRRYHAEAAPPLGNEEFQVRLFFMGRLKSLNQEMRAPLEALLS